MIISASYKTDIPAFYSEWFRRRLSEGHCRMINPYGGQRHDISLKPSDIDGFVFWTRNIEPFLSILDHLKSDDIPFFVHYTLTGYPRPLEPSVVPAERSLALIRELAARFGPRAVVWRYDPVFITSLTPPTWHRRNFDRLAAGLAGCTDEVVLSFAHIYAKTRSNADRAARRHGFAWSDPDAEEKRALLEDLAGLARARALTASLCAQPELLGPRLRPARCVDAARLGDLAGHGIDVREQGNRPGCLCAQSRDIGAYDSCPHGCIYCYAVRRQELAKQRFRRHDPERAVLAEEAGR